MSTAMEKQSVRMKWMRHRCLKNKADGSKRIQKRKNGVKEGVTVVLEDDAIQRDVVGNM